MMKSAYDVLEWRRIRKSRTLGEFVPGLEQDISPKLAYRKQISIHSHLGDLCRGTGSTGWGWCLRWGMVSLELVV